MCTLYMYEYCSVCTSCTVVVVCVETVFIPSVLLLLTMVEKCLLFSSNYIYIHPTALKQIANFIQLVLVYYVNNGTIMLYSHCLRMNITPSTLSITSVLL